MTHTLDFDAIMAPIPGDNPAGTDLRYSPIYDNIKEARRADDTLDRGDWQRELKSSDWESVIKLSLTALTTQTKDLQIAVWLTEALTKTDGFVGFVAGTRIITGLLKNFWEHLYPEIDDGDLDYRVGPLEFANDKISFSLQKIPLTDPGVSDGYSLVNWKEAQQVSQASPQMREALITEGKTTMEQFEAAVRKSSLLFYENLHETLQDCVAAFKEFDETVDDTFGRDAPRLSEISSMLEEAGNHVTRFVKDKGGDTNRKKPEETPQTPGQPAASAPAPGPEAPVQNTMPGDASPSAAARKSPSAQTVPQQVVADFAPGSFQVIRFLGSGGKEDLLWQEALNRLKSEGIESALEMLLGASRTAQSTRDETGCRLLMVKICLRAGRSDLAWPIAEELYKLVTDLQLERWESPIWIAEAYGCLYECLNGEDASEEDKNRANQLLVKICTLDITLAMKYAG
ncbi:MAG: type VI secretion system protein TssA [Pseudomonadota bacterium]